MRRLGFVVVSFLLFALLYVQNGNISTVKAYSGIYQGDLILTGNNVTTIDERFDINGSIIVEENATLILKNTVINFVQTEIYQHSMTLRNPLNGNPRLQSKNSTITSNLNYFKVELFQNSSATISDSADTCYLSVHDSAVASVFNSTIAWLTVHGSAIVTVFNSRISTSLQAWGSSIASISNSTIETLHIGSSYVNCSLANIGPGFFAFWNHLLNSSVALLAGGSAPNVTVRNTEIDNWSLYFGSSNAIITDSKLAYLSSDGYSNVWLINSTAFLISTYNWGEVYVSWYLDVHVIDSISQNVPSANVTAVYPNTTVVESRLTDVNGWTRLTLMEKMVNATGDYPVGNYTVEAGYESYSNNATVNITGNQEITLQLPFVIPEFPSFLILPLFVIATLTAVVVYRRKKLL